MIRTVGPAVYRFLPDRAKPAVFHRIHNPPPAKWQHIFAAAPLKYAPKVRMELCPTDVSHGCIAFAGFVELRLTRHIVNRARRGGLMLDVGANAGYFSLLWAANNPANRSIAFEPSRSNSELFRRNVRQNHLEHQIEIRPQAAGNRAGMVTFDPGCLAQTGWGGITRCRNSNTISVECVRIEEALDTSTFVDLMKIDVEGAETWVLMGCEQLLRGKRIKEIQFEQNKPRARALDIPDTEPFSFLASVGYRTIARSNPNGQLVEWQAIPL
jgi:FkbM family methyltransferase